MAGFIQEKQEIVLNKDTGFDGKMESVSTSAMQETAGHLSKCFAIDQRRAAAIGGRRQLAATISSLDG